MIKKTFSLLSVVLIAACDGGTSVRNGDTPMNAPQVVNPTQVVNPPPINVPVANTPAVNPPAVTPPAVTPPAVTPTPVTPPAVGERSGAYVGDFGSGQGVYVLSPSNQLSGLALSADGTAHSLFGDLGGGNTFNGGLRPYFHTASTPADQGIFSAGEPGANAPTPAATQFNLNIIEGQTIESLSGAAVSLTAAGAGGISPSTPAAVAGFWSGSHQFCGADLNNCSNLVTEITFSGNDVNGRTLILAPDGTEQFANPIVGSIEQSGDVSTLTYTWNNNTYIGSIFFLPGSNTQLVFLGETPAQDANNRTIASLLTR